MPHLHIPLQSGDNDVLEKMNRRYSAEFFTTVIDRIHEALPDAAIGCDILCGFPGEDDRAHDNSYRLIQELPVTYLHVFPFSKRAGTLAASMKNQVSQQSREERVRRLRSLDTMKREAFYRRFVGTTQRVLIEQKNRKNHLRGFSENYLPIECSGPASLAGEIVPLRIVAMGDGVLIGRVTKS